jgi:hypothetical protein
MEEASLMPYVATMNTPGYLPWSDDEPPVFETSRDAWSYLADERREQAARADDITPDSTADELDAMAAADAGEGTVYGSTPGSDSPHDLGIAYCVTEFYEAKKPNLSPGVAAFVAENYSALEPLYVTIVAAAVTAIYQGMVAAKSLRGSDPQRAYTGYMILATARELTRE